MWNSKIDPLYIGSEEIRTGNTRTMSAPHDHKHIVIIILLKNRISKAIANALESSAGQTWLGNSELPFS
jgi:1-pyrroline-5-carboxylate dehydrogenase